MKPIIGMTLLTQPVRTVGGLTARFDVWTIKGVGKERADGSVKLTLISAAYDPGAEPDAPYASMEATATLPNGVIEEPFKAFVLSQDDRRKIWEGTPFKIWEGTP